MPIELEPEELAKLVDAAERPRAEGWSLRAALTRYAQPQPQRASTLIELLRRIEHALRQHMKDLERNGAVVWRAVVDDAANGTPLDADTRAVMLLRALRRIDELGDLLATWAIDRATERPDEVVDSVTREVADQLEVLGVPHEERPRPPRGGRRG